MTIAREWIIGLVSAAVLLVCFGCFEWLQEHDARMKAQGVQDAQAQVIKASQAAIDKAKTDQDQTANELKAQLAAIQAQRVVVVTPQQAAAVANTLPNLPQQVQVQTVPAQPATSSTPAQAATQQIVIPQADIPAFQKYKLDCDESTAKLTACTLNAANAAVIQKATDDQLKAMTTERNTWEATAKGGTFWQKVKHDLVVVAVAGGTAYAIGRLTK